MIDTRTGNALTTRSPEAARLYQQAIDLILSSESGATEALDNALELDDGFAVAAAARYYLAKDVGEDNAQAFKEQAQRASQNASVWEREHIDVLIGLMDSSSETREKALAYIRTNPSDLLVISQLAGAMFFYDGPNKLQNVMNLFESVEHALSDDWAFLARLGFAASEAGQRQRGRVLLERALAIRPQSLYSIHGLAHMLHDEGAADESAKVLEDWLKKHGETAIQGQMYGHVQWHLALAEFQVGNRQAAIERYQKYCAPETTTCGPILTLADCGGFLLRDYLQTAQPAPLGEDVLKHIDRVWGMMGHPFVVLHVAGLYATAGDLAGLKRCEDVVAEKIDDANKEISLVLISALRHFVNGNFQETAETLATLSASTRIGIGGSNVERILVDLIEASSLARQ